MVLACEIYVLRRATADTKCCKRVLTFDTSAFISLANPPLRLRIFIFPTRGFVEESFVSPLSKLFRNVPLLTQERMSPSLVVVRCTLSPAGVAGRREAGA